MKNKILKCFSLLIFVFIVAVYVFKIFYPELICGVLNSEALAIAGSFVQSNIWFIYLFEVLTSFIVYGLFTCASCKQWYLKWWQFLIVLAFSCAGIGFGFVDYELSIAYKYSSIILVPVLCGAKDLRIVGAEYALYLFAGSLTSNILDLSAYLENYNIVINELLSIECYLLLLLFYFLFNNCKQKKINNVPNDKKPIEENKISKINSKITKLNKTKAIYEEKIAKRKNKA